MKALTKENLIATLAQSRGATEFSTPVSKPRFQASTGNYAGQWHQRRAEINRVQTADVNGKKFYLVPFYLKIYPMLLSQRPVETPKGGPAVFGFVYMTPVNKVSKAQVADLDAWKSSPDGLDNWTQVDTRKGREHEGALVEAQTENGEWILINAKDVADILMGHDAEIRIHLA